MNKKKHHLVPCFRLGFVCRGCSPVISSTVRRCDPLLRRLCPASLGSRNNQWPALLALLISRADHGRRAPQAANGREAGAKSSCGDKIR